MEKEDIMESSRFRIIAVGFALLAGAAAAQDVGFFRPAADPALTTTYPVPATPPQPVQAGPMPAPPPAAVGPTDETAQMAAAELAATRQAEAMRWAEEQMERSRREAEQSREPAQPAPGVGAAFTGSTSERDR
jgi:hypothetical protein